MTVALKIVLVILLALIGFELKLILEFFWYKNVFGKFNYGTIFGFTEIASLVAATPGAILYFAMGLLLFNESSKYIWAFALAVLVLEVTLISHGFTEHSTLQIKIWAYLSYFLPSLFAIMGNKLSQRLARYKTTATDRAHSKPKSFAKRLRL